MDLSIIYVNWNSLDYLRESITSVYTFTHQTSFEIVVVDNASPEGGIDIIKDHFPEIKLIKSESNLGFAGANNLGFRNSCGKYILLLNPDTKLLEPSIDIMMNYMRSLPGAGIVGCKLLNTDGSVQLSSIQKFPSILNQVIDAEFLRTHWPNSPLWGIAPLFKNDVGIIPVEVIPGACMLIRRNVFEQAGCYSEDYFMYAEDLDLNYKVARLGYKNYYVGSTAIVHHGGKSSSKQEINHWASIMKYKAMVLYFRKTHGRFHEVAYRGSIMAAAIVRMGALVLLKPFSSRLGNRDSLEFSFNKWRAIWKWSIGGQEFSRKNG